MNRFNFFFEKYGGLSVGFVMAVVSVFAFYYFYSSGLGLAYNDARSHLDIGRRVVEGLTPGLAQLGSVWLPLPHFLMIFTVWSDFMWHSGLSGSLISMASYVSTGLYVWLILKKLGVGHVARLLGVAVFAFNANILYLQSTAMTELLLILTLTAAIYEMLCYFSDGSKYSLVKGAFWIMLSTLVRYEGWFLFFVAAVFICIYSFLKKGKKEAEGMLILFATLSGFGIFMWFIWNKLIFDDFLFFAFGPYSAHAQQDQLAAAGDLITRGNLIFSGKIYFWAIYYCAGFAAIAATFLGSVLIFFDKRMKTVVRVAAVIFLLSPVLFNVLALFLGHSVVFVEGVSGKSWFNIRYGVMVLPAAAVFTSYLADRAKQAKYLVIGLFLIYNIVSVFNINKAVTIADALYGSSGKDVSQIAGWLKDHVKDPNSRILVSAASHDAVIFSSGLDMKQIIHEGTGPFWESATITPDKWARYIVMRTNDKNDSTFRLLEDKKLALERYELAYKGNFADIYELKGEYMQGLAQDFSISAFGDWRGREEDRQEAVEQNKEDDKVIVAQSSNGLVPGFYKGPLAGFFSIFALVVFALVLPVSGKISGRGY